MTLTEQRVAKVTKDRIFSVAIHPTEEKVLVIGGDKWGKVGFWDVVRSVYIKIKLKYQWQKNIYSVNIHFNYTVVYHGTAELKVNLQLYL